MERIVVKPVQVIGTCPAGLTLEDGFQIEGMRLWNDRGSTIRFESFQLCRENTKGGWLHERRIHDHGR
jgi:hypothetical protein